MAKATPKPKVPAKPQGRPKKIKDPATMWAHFLNYKKWVEENPRIIVEQKRSSTSFKIYGGADVEGLKEEMQEAGKPIVQLPYQRPLTMEGFENWLFEQDIISDVSDYFENKNESYTSFLPICSRIRKIIRQDQIEGGMCGIYNPSITQRLNNLVDKKDVTSDGKRIDNRPLPTINIVMPKKPEN